MPFGGHQYEVVEKGLFAKSHRALRDLSPIEKVNLICKILSILPPSHAKRLIFERVIRVRPKV